MVEDKRPVDSIITVQQHIIEAQGRHPTATGQFSWLLSGITLACKVIASYVRRAGLVDVLGATEETNVQGEIVQKLDHIANDALMKALGYREDVGIIASEEDNEPRVLQEVGRGRYVVMFDPLDGSSNIDVNVSVGTIFTIFQRPEWDHKAEYSVIQPGYQQVAAGYVLYGSSTVMVYTTGNGVHMFTLDPQFGAFLLTRQNIRIPARTNQYSVNEAYSNSFPEPYQQYLTWAKEQVDEPFSSRYIGSLVADFHRILLKGGVFLYPPTQKNREGKLRLMYEANPLAFIAEQAGGAASDGHQRILDIQPRSLHQRTPLILGSRDNVEDVLRFVRAYEATHPEAHPRRRATDKVPAL